MIIVIDYGSQYSQLIVRRIRSFGVWAVICPPDRILETIKKDKPQGIVLSGGPGNISFDCNGSTLPAEIFQVPVLGICYGMQIIAGSLGGIVDSARKKEFGATQLQLLKKEDSLFSDIPVNSEVWMSHKDEVLKVPEKCIVLAQTENCKIAAIKHKDKPVWGVQFHPEVQHTQFGTKIIENFLFKIVKARKDWDMADYIETQIQTIRDQVGDKGVVCAVSGGVDSSVMAEILHRAIGDQLTCVFVNNGLLRLNEPEIVQERFQEKLNIFVHYIDASYDFLRHLRGVVDPEEKRKIVGKTFIDVFYSFAQRFDFLAQGTLYPDVIESVSTGGASDTIKTHHNRVDQVLELIKEGRIIEPLKDLFKDEVREIGKILGIPHDMLMRHPFPGPGLSIRILGEVRPDRLDILREADYILMYEIKESGWYEKVWQAFAILLPIRSVGVMGDARTYDYTCVLRIVGSIDAMTADWARIPYPILGKIANRIVNEVEGINRVVYDVSSKPPATIEWE